MADFNIRQFLNNALAQQKLRNPQMGIKSFSVNSSNAGVAENLSSQVKLPPSSMIPLQEQNMQVRTLKSMDMAIYAKDLMGVPKNINEFIYMMQKGLTNSQFNQMFSSQLALQRNSLSQLQAQILAQLQGLDLSNVSEFVNKQMNAQLQSSLKNLDILSNGMINLSQIAQMIQANGKDALTKIIMTMTQASKMGVNDLSQLKDMARYINASIAIASENEPSKTMKLLLLLYLPWLPLKEGVDFDLEITANSSKSESDSILTITITTLNYGTVIATLYLETSNSVQVTIECSENFPKSQLEERLHNDQNHYSMNALTTFDVKNNLSAKQESKQANINMSQTTEINPYLLLMAHSIIKHVIDIDNNFSIRERK